MIRKLYNVGIYICSCQKLTAYYFIETEEGEVTDSCSGEDSDNEDRISRHILEKLGIVNIT